MAIQIAPKQSKLAQQKALLGGKVAPKKEQKIATVVSLQKPVEKDLAIADIRLDQSAQPREHLSVDKTSEYAEAMEAGSVFPPLVVFFDGKDHWLADGFHRHYAAQQIKRTKIRCLVHIGKLRDAILYSVGANAAHGLPRSDNDKERAVLRLLNDSEWSKWSDREVAKHCHVSHTFVAGVRRKNAAVTGVVASERTYTTKHGTVATMNTAGINAGRTEFQAKAPEDNGRITGGAGPVTGGASRLASGRTDAGEEASVDLPNNSERRENDFYPTPESLIAEIVARWTPKVKKVWEPCDGDGRVRIALQVAGYEVVAGDIAQGQDFFACTAPPAPGIALFTNPPFNRLREFIDHAFAIGITEMCLVLPERVWASGIGRKQFERHRPSLWVNLDWREDYLGKGGSPDRALAVAIWNEPCAPVCEFQVWGRRQVDAA